jgi:hypothetical protein
MPVLATWTAFRGTEARQVNSEQSGMTGQLLRANA